MESECRASLKKIQNQTSLARGTTEVEECLSNKHEALSSNPSTTKTNK
jgi:hypothetical protein